MIATIRSSLASGLAVGPNDAEAVRHELVLGWPHNRPLGDVTALHPDERLALAQAITKAMDEIAAGVAPSSQPVPCAPWPDYADQPVHEGDTIEHPDGMRALVCIDPLRHVGDVGKWRAVYASGESLWLGNQIGSKGQAKVVRGTTPVPEDTPLETSEREAQEYKQ